MIGDHVERVVQATQGTTTRKNNRKKSGQGPARQAFSQTMS